MNTSTNSRRLLVAVSAMALLAACGGGEKKAGHKGKAGEEAAAQQAMPVEVVTLTAGKVDNIRTFSGRARAFNEAEIRPQVSGIIKERLFEQGQDVLEGAPLYKIVDDEYVAAVQSAKAALKSAQAAANVASTTAKRMKALVDQNAVSRQEYDDAEAALSQALASVDAQKAALDNAQISLDRTTIKAPLSGTIGRSAVTQGALVSQGQPNALAKISQLDPIFVDLTVPSVDILEYQQNVASGEITGASKDGVPITILFENGTEYPHKGVLKVVEVTVDERAGTVAVRGDVPNPDRQLMPGMFLRASVSAGTIENAVTVPQGAIVRTPTGANTVLVVTPDNKVEQRSLEIRGSFGNSWIIKSGVSAGDKVILSGLQRLRPGMSVEPQEKKQDNGAQ